MSDTTTAIKLHLDDDLDEEESDEVNEEEQTEETSTRLGHDENHSPNAVNKEEKTEETDQKEDANPQQAQPRVAEEEEQIVRKSIRKLKSDMPEEEQFEYLFNGTVEELIDEITRKEGDLYKFLKRYVSNMLDLYNHKKSTYIKEVEKIHGIIGETRRQMRQIYNSVYDDRLTKSLYFESGFKRDEIPEKDALEWSDMEIRIEALKASYFPRYNSIVGNLGKFKLLVVACQKKLKELEKLKDQYFNTDEIALVRGGMVTRSKKPNAVVDAQQNIGEKTLKQSKGKTIKKKQLQKPQLQKPVDLEKDATTTTITSTGRVVQPRTIFEPYMKTDVALKRIEREKKAAEEKSAEELANEPTSNSKQEKQKKTLKPTTQDVVQEDNPGTYYTDEQMDKIIEKNPNLVTGIEANKQRRGEEAAQALENTELVVKLSGELRAKNPRMTIPASINRARKILDQQNGKSSPETDETDLDDDVDNEVTNEIVAKWGEETKTKKGTSSEKNAHSLLSELINVMKSCLEDIQRLSTSARKVLRNQICRILLNMGSPLKSSKPNRFLNIVLTGDAGMGKSLAANCIGKVMAKSGILCSDDFHDVDAVSPKDFIGQYMGETALKTFNLLQQNFERVLFCDEAYGFVNCTRDEDGNAVLEKGTGGNQYGNEALTEMLTFMDKYQGMHVLIIAGYKSSIFECFFGSNPGLQRRFPTIFDLNKYSNAELLKIYENLMETYKKDNIRIGTPMKEFISGYLNFKNQAGDMQNLFMYYENHLNNAARQHNVTDHTQTDTLKMLQEVEKRAIEDFRASVEFGRKRPKQKPTGGGSYLKKTRRRRASKKKQSYHKKQNSKTKYMV